MANEVDKPLSMSEQFQQNVKEAILGAGVEKLLPPDALKELVDKAAHELFFKERIEKTDYYGRPEVKKPSWFIELIMEEAKPLVQEQIREYLRENQHVILESIQQYMEKGLPQRVIDYINDQTRGDFQNMMHNFMQVWKSMPQNNR